MVKHNSLSCHQGISTCPSFYLDVNLSSVGAQSSNVSCHQSSVALIYPTKERLNHQGISQSLGCKYGIG